MNNQGTFLSNFLNIYVSPLDVFRALKVKPNFLYPLLIIICSSITILLMYYMSVDFNWLNEYIISMDGVEHTEAEKKQMLEALSQMTPMIQGTLTATAANVALLLFISILSFYFVIVSMITADSNRFKSWFSVISWSFMPMVLVSLAAGINIIITSNNQLPIDQINPLTLNNIFFHVGFDSSFKSLLNSIDLAYIWTIVLLIIGYQSLTNKSRLSSISIVLTPFVLIYGIWLLVIIV